MEQIEMKTIGEAKHLMSSLAIIQIGLALQQGHTVTVVDEHKGIEYVFKPDKTADSGDEESA